MNTSPKRPLPSQSNRILVILGIFWVVLAVTIMFIQLGSPAHIEIAWETETEFDTAGFNVYRSESPDGEFVRINDQLIPSAADAAAGAAYLFIDENVERGRTYYYRLEDVEYSSATQQHEVLTGQASSVAGWAVVLAVISAAVGVVLIAGALKPKRINGANSGTQAIA